MNMVSVLVQLFLFFCCILASDGYSPKGTAASPLAKKKVAVIGGGGYMGAITFGFLQRAGSLYGTGIDRNCRCIGATSGTAVALNTVLGKHFVLAQADESFIKLTNMQSAKDIQNSLQGYDAVIFGYSMVVEPRPITQGTFEKGPNDKTIEVYWDTFRGKEMALLESDLQAQVPLVIDNILEACKGASSVQHVVAVATGKNNADFSNKIKSCGIPYTLLQCPGTLSNIPDYTYRKGIQGNIQVTVASDDGGGEFLASDSSFPVYREDLAALCVQCLQSLDWTQPRTLLVKTGGDSLDWDGSGKRSDQEWCVNSDALAAKLLSV